MGLTKEVRDFFTNRINAVLDTKLAEILKPVNDEKVKNESVRRFCAKYGDENFPKRYQKLEQQKETLREEEKKIEAEIKAIFEKVKCSVYYPHFCNIEDFAEKEFKSEVMNDLYPSAYREAKKIEEIKADVQGAVLLSTTEPKLVATLSKLLNTYGGEINELLALIPKQE